SCSGGSWTGALWQDPPFRRWAWSPRARCWSARRRPEAARRSTGSSRRWPRAWRSEGGPQPMRETVPLLFESGAPGRRGFRFAPCDVPEIPLEEALPPESLRREPAPLPELSEVEVIRHYVRLSRRNYAVDVGIYPLGSCTMKYNPKAGEEA